MWRRPVPLGYRSNHVGQLIDPCGCGLLVELQVSQRQTHRVRVVARTEAKTPLPISAAQVYTVPSTLPPASKRSPEDPFRGQRRGLKRDAAAPCRQPAAHRGPVLVCRVLRPGRPTCRPAVGSGIAAGVRPTLSSTLTLSPARALTARRTAVRAHPHAGEVRPEPAIHCAGRWRVVANRTLFVARHIAFRHFAPLRGHGH